MHPTAKPVPSTRSARYHENVVIPFRSSSGCVMNKANDQAVPVQCPQCGMLLKVPVGGKRLCVCGAWVSGDAAGLVDVEPAAEPTVAEPTVPVRSPRIEGDLAAI